MARARLSVRVAADCASDVYAIRAPNADWPSLRAALLADGRLSISEDGGTWTIRLNPANRAAEKRALAQYEESVRSQLHGLFEPAVRRTRELMLLPAEARLREEAQERSASKADPKHPTRNEVVSAMAWEAVDERDFASVAVPCLLTEPGVPLDVAWMGDAIGSASLLAPSGSVPATPLAEAFAGKTPDGEVLGRLRSATLAGKLVWDPLTLTVGYRWSFRPPEFARILDQTDSGQGVAMLAPESFSNAVKTPMSVPTTGWHSATFGSRQEWEAEEATTNEPLSVSEAVLRWAEAEDASIVDYVSPLNDLCLSARPTRSLVGIARDANLGAVERSWIWGVVQTWTGLEVCRPWNPIDSLPQTQRLTLLGTHGFAVVRTETRYLDLLVSRAMDLTPDSRNLRFKGTPPTLEEIVRVEAKLEPDDWKGGLTPLPVLDTFNPIAFYPIAVLLADHPGLVQEIQALKPDGNLTRSFAKLPRTLRFRNALQRAAPFNDAISYGMLDPIFLPKIVHDDSVPLCLWVARGKGVLTFRVAVPTSEGRWDGKLLWDATVRLPQ